MSVFVSLLSQDNMATATMAAAMDAAVPLANTERIDKLATQQLRVLETLGSATVVYYSA